MKDVSDLYAVHGISRELYIAYSVDEDEYRSFMTVISIPHQCKSKCLKT